METKLQATNMELTDAIRAYVDKRLAAVLKLVDPEDTSALCNVEVERTTRHHKSGPIFRAEINLHIAGQVFRAEARGETVNKAIDETKNQMTKELRRYKDKKISGVRKGGARLKDVVRGFRKK